MADEDLTKQIAQKISNGTVTVGEFLAAAKLQNPKVKGVDTLSTYFSKELSKPWKEVANEATVSKMLDVANDKTTSSTFVNIQNVEKQTALFYKANKNLIDNPATYLFTTQNDLQITGDGGIARGFGTKADNPKAYQPRGTKKFKSVPKADITVPKLIQATKNIPHDGTRGAVAFNLLVPFRPGEIADLLVSDIDLDTGLVSALNRGNKTRTELFLPEVALEILRDAVEDANKQGRDTVFDTSVDKMSKALKVKGGLKDLLLANKATLGRELTGVADIRKLIPSLLAKELGAASSLVSSILGHAEGADGLLGQLESITANHYVSAVEDVASDPKKHALNVIQHMLASNIGATTLNELPPAFGVSAKTLTMEGAIAIEALSGAFDSSIVPQAEARTLTATERELIDTRARATKATLEEAESKALLNKITNNLETEKKQKELLTAKNDPEKLRLEAELTVNKKQAKDVATAELLGEPTPEVEPKPKLADVSDADLKDIGYSDSEIANIRSSETSGNYLEAEQTRIEAKARMRLEKMESAKNKISSFMKSGAAKKLAIGAATTAIGIGLTGGVKAADVVLDVALDPTNMGGTAEDASTADLERGVATGESLPKSGSYRANEQELGNMQRELQGRKDSEVQGQQVMDTTPAGGFALQNAQNVKSTFEDEYSGYTGFIRN